MSIFTMQELEAWDKVTKDWPFNPVRWAWDNAEVMDVDSGYPRLEPKMCINNSVIMCLLNRDYKYVEGWMRTRHGFLCYHAWNYNEASGTYYDHTTETERAISYKGLVIPMEVLIMCAAHKAWTRSVGCIQTMCHFSDSELLGVKKLLEGC